MKVTRRRGRLRLHLDRVEAELLGSLLTELDTTVRSTDEADPVVHRLYPSAYPDDDVAAAEFRGLTRTGLQDARAERIAGCRAELFPGGGDVRDIDLELADDAAATRWIQVLNDLRLALGTRIGVTEEDEEFDLSDPEQQPRVVYHWLTAVQDTLVTALMR